MSLRSSLFVLLVVSAVILAGCSSTQPGTTTQTTSLSNTGGPTGEQWTVTITRIVDGDTVQFEYQNGTQDTGRLLGVDTPEVHTANDPEEFEGVPNDDSGAACLRNWGHRASEFARTELAGERVTLFLDSNEGPRDRYDRLLIYVRDDGKLFNYRLVSQGYARVYDSQFTKRDRFYSAELKAQQGTVGLWECRDGSGKNGATTASATGLTVARIHADADGNDHDNLNDEFVVLENSGNDALDISGWTVSDADGHTYRVPSGVSLTSGESVTLYTGSGPDSASKLYWESGRAIWNNAGDTVVVRDGEGVVVVRKRYS